LASVVCFWLNFAVKDPFGSGLYIQIENDQTSIMTVLCEMTYCYAYRTTRRQTNSRSVKSRTGQLADSEFL